MAITRAAVQGSRLSKFIYWQIGVVITDESRDSLATGWRYGEIFKGIFTATLLLNLLVKGMFEIGEYLAKLEARKFVASPALCTGQYPTDR